MNKEQAFQALEAKKKHFRSKIPANASKMRLRFLQGLVEDEVDAAGKHLQAVYESRLEVGPNLTALSENMNNPKYGFWLEGIRRHLQECEEILNQQPEGA
jgi:hypothetical protein